MIISCTPVRVSFFGGGTDYPDYYNTHGGAVIGTTIDKHIFVSLNEMGYCFDYRYRVSYSRMELCQSLEEILHPSVRECLRYGNWDRNLDIHVFADLPARSGLGSSSSFTVCFLNALHALSENSINKDELTSQAIHIEQNMIGENVGSQDQAHAAHGGFNLIEFSDKGVSVKPIEMLPGCKQAMENSIQAFFTGQTRTASDLVVEQMEKTRSHSNNDFLKRMHEMVYDGQRLLETSTPDTIAEQMGRMLHESWGLKKSLSSKVSNQLIDRAYSDGIKAGAFGGKLLGAGGGGFLCFISPIDAQEAVRRAVNLPEIKIRFENDGARILHVDPAQ